ncbi:Cytochrome P450 [Pricia antarctica]|uniref:Cytochrome P450 n=1 Tax=Pricia antarctica TaxID=641691 RepID=A0A1G7AGN6_9FLAO|nr:cytochrome P450 [Pricia antarctica]SDE13942.1 Cytochrome P450 [Pricia antarctica]
MQMMNESKTTIRPASVSKKSAVPSVPQLEVFKNQNAILRNPLPFHHENFEKLGDTFMVKLGAGYKIIFTRNPDTIKYILQKNHKNYQKSPLQTKDLGKYIGQGLLTSNGEHWRKHRRMVQPAFHKKKLVGLLDVMWAAVEEEIRRIEANKVQNVLPMMGDLAFQVVARALFSAEDIRERMQKLQRITVLNQKMLIREMRRPYLKWWFQLDGSIKRHLELSKDAQKILDGIVEERLAGEEEKDDLLDMLLQAKYEDGTAMPRKQLLDELLILFTAGHETTANALSFTLYLLAKHPKIQEKLYQETQTVDFENGNQMQNLSLLTFTQQCIEEAMRLYPPVYVIDRVSLKDDVVEDLSFKKRTTWLLSMYELHRSRHWEHPDEFMPERFAADQKKSHSDFYYPFGAGPRMCVGNNFAMYEMIMAVAGIVKKYILTTDMAEVILDPLVSLRPKEVMLRFSER